MAEREPTEAEFLAELHADELPHYKSGRANQGWVDGIKARWLAKQPPAPVVPPVNSDPSPEPESRYEPPPETLDPMEKEHQRTKLEQLKKSLKALGIPEPRSPVDIAKEAVKELLPKESPTEVLEREARERQEWMEPPPPDVPDLSIYSDIKPFSPDPAWHKRPDLILAVILFCLGGVLAIGLVLLPRESPGAIVFWLAIMFSLLAACELLLAHFLNSSKPKALAGLMVPAILVFGFGWYIWPSRMPELSDKGRQSSPSPLASPSATPSPAPATTSGLTPSPTPRQANPKLKKPQSRCSAEDRLLGRC